MRVRTDQDGDQWHGSSLVRRFDRDYIEALRDLRRRVELYQESMLCPAYVTREERTLYWLLRDLVDELDRILPTESR